MRPSRPFYARAQADFTPEAFFGPIYRCPRDEGARAIQPFVVEIDDAIDVAAAVCPYVLMIERDAPSCSQTVASASRHDGVRHVYETIEAHVGIHHLDLRCDAELAADRDSLAGLDAEGQAAALSSVRVLRRSELRLLV